jgi:hypothetical protein
MADSSQSAPMLDTDDELAALQALASELAAEAEERARPRAAADVDESAVARRTQSILRRRSSEDMDKEEPLPMGPPLRFVRKPRPERPAVAGGEEAERRTLIVSTLFPGVRPPVRTVRWARKRKPDAGWEDESRPARARDLAGSVAYT